MSEHGYIVVVHFQINDLMLSVIVVWWLWMPLESGPSLLLLVFFVYLTDMKVIHEPTTSGPIVSRFNADCLPHGLLPLILVDKAIHLEVEELLVRTQEVVSCAGIDELQPIDLEDVLVILFRD